jgi:hypothetical protein
LVATTKRSELESTAKGCVHLLRSSSLNPVLLSK